MKWPHKVSVWLWQGDSAIFEALPCLISDYTADRLLPPSEYGNLGRSQQRLLSYRMRCPLWSYPFLQELSPIAITPSPQSSNPFGRHFDASSEGESLFISDISIHGGILDVYLDALVTNPLGVRDANSSLFIPNQPLAPLPPKPVRLPDLRWYWVVPASQDNPSQWGSDGFPTATNVPTRLKFQFEDSRLQPIVNIRSEIDVDGYIQARYNLPDDVSTLKFSFIDADNNQYNLNELNYTIGYSDTSVAGVLGVLGFDIYMRGGLVRGLELETLRRLRFYPVNGQQMIVYNSVNAPYYNSNILSRWGDTTYRVTT